MIVGGFVGNGGPWLALIISGAAVGAALVMLVRYGRGEHVDPRALSALPIGGFGAALGLLTALVPCLVVLPPNTSSVVLAATNSDLWQGSAIVVAAAWLCAMGIALRTVHRYQRQRGPVTHQHV